MLLGLFNTLDFTYSGILPPEGNSCAFAEALRRTIFRDGANLL
jgi:hypothetical protein